MESDELFVKGARVVGVDAAGEETAGYEVGGGEAAELETGFSRGEVVGIYCGCA